MVNRLSVTTPALAAAGTVLAMWKFQLKTLLFQLQTLRSKAAQELGPVSASEVLAGLRSADAETAKVQAQISQDPSEQARAAGFVLAHAFLRAEVKLRKAEEGFLRGPEPRYHKPFEWPNDISGYNAGLLLRALVPEAHTGDTLGVNVPGLARRRFALTGDQQSFYAFLPFINANRYPLYHFRGTLTLALDSRGAVRSLRRSLDVQQRLLDQWSSVGPFPLGQAPDLGGTLITAATLHKSYEGKDGKTVSWVSVQTATGHLKYPRGRRYLRRLKRWIDLSILYPDHDASAVAATWVKASKPLIAKVSVRNADGIEVWINRTQIFNSPHAAGAATPSGPPPVAVKVPLHQGWNQVVVRTSHATNDWGFSVRFALPAGVVCEQSSTPPAPHGAS